MDLWRRISAAAKALYPVKVPAHDHGSERLTPADDAGITIAVLLVIAIGVVVGFFAFGRKSVAESVEIAPSYQLLEE